MAVYLSVFTSPAGEAETLKAYQEVLEQWPVPYKELMLPTSFGDTHVIASGAQDAPVVILLHALFATATVWYSNVGVLSQHYRTYAVDILGEGNKSCPTRPIATLEEYTQWFEELLDRLGVQEAYLIGNSNGAFLSAKFAMELPKRIRKLVLIGPAATIHSIVPFYVHMFVPKLLYMFFPKVPGIKRLDRKSVV